MRQGNSGAILQFAFADTPDRVQDLGEGIVIHAKGLRRHTSRAGKWRCADHGGSLTAFLKHQSIVYTTRATRPSIADPYQYSITLRCYLIEQSNGSRSIGSWFAIIFDFYSRILLAQ